MPAVAAAAGADDEAATVAAEEAAASAEEPAAAVELLPEAETVNCERMSHGTIMRRLNL